MWPTWLVLWGWALLTVAGLIYWIKDRVSAVSMPFPVYAAWGLAIIFFGPLGALSYLVVKGSSAAWRSALQESLFSSAGVTTALLFQTVIVATLKPEGSIVWLAISLAFMIGWLLFRAPQRAARLGEGYLVAARRTFYSQILVTLLALAGQLGALILLEMRWFPFGEDITHPLYWIQLIPAGIAGALLVFPYHCWLAWRERAKIRENFICT
jgi:hypothetical protein